MDPVVTHVHVFREPVLDVSVGELGSCGVIGFKRDGLLDVVKSG